MYMGKHVILVAALAICQAGFAEDLYDYSGKLRDIKAGDPIVAADTVGGFPFTKKGEVGGLSEVHRQLPAGEF